MTSEAKTLEYLIDKHCSPTFARTTLQFTPEGLRSLIKEVVGEPVARVNEFGTDIELKPNPDLSRGENLHALKVTL